MYSLYSLYSIWTGIFEKKCDGKLVEQFRIKVVSTQQHCCRWHSNIITLQTILTSAASVPPFRWPTISAKLDGKTNLHMKSPGHWMILNYFAAGRSPHSYAGPPTGPGWPILDTGLTWWQVKYIILDILCLYIYGLCGYLHFFRLNILNALPTCLNWLKMDNIILVLYSPLCGLTYKK